MADNAPELSRLTPLPDAERLRATVKKEFEESIGEFEVKSFKKKVKKAKLIKYWGVIAIIDGRKIKVIVRKIGDNGAMHFWSVVPAWVTNKYRDTKFFTTMKKDNSNRTN